MTSIMPDKEDMGLGWLHIFQQEGAHQPARILGNLRGLLLLQVALDAAIKDTGYVSHAESAEVFARDGEAYRVQVYKQRMLVLLGEPPYTK
jgi:hypothetical protein